MRETLFVYGTLHDPRVQKILLGRTLASRPDVLPRYRRNLELFPPYPVAMPDESASINGWVLKVTAKELEKLDHYEGENYVRVRVTLASGSDAWVYRGNPVVYDETIRP